MENKEKVIGWIRSGMDYNEGIALLVEITHREYYFNQFTGSMRSMALKLAYEICKAAGVADVRTWKKFIQDAKDAPEPEVGEISPHVGEAPDSGKLPALTDENKNQSKEFIPNQEVDTKEASLDENPLKEYPSIIRRVMYEYTSMFQERSKLHTVMVEMDSSNAPAVMVKRAELFDLIKAMSVRLEQFHQAKDKFETDGTLPVEKELFPPEEIPEEADINLLDEESLKKRKKNLQNSNSKDQSFLDYQSSQHGATKNPMPAGPKRVKIEYRMKQRVKLMEEIDTALLKYVIKE